MSLVWANGVVPPRDTERLGDIDIGADHEFARVVDLADDVNLVAQDLFDGNRDDQVRDVACQLGFHVEPHFLDGAAGRLDVGDQRKGKLAVGPDDDIALQVGLFPDDDRQHVAGIHHVGRAGRGGLGGILRQGRPGKYGGGEQQCRQGGCSRQAGQKHWVDSWIGG